MKFLILDSVFPVNLISSPQMTVCNKNRAWDSLAHKGADKPHSKWGDGSRRRASVCRASQWDSTAKLDHAFLHHFLHIAVTADPVGEFLVSDSMTVSSLAQKQDTKYFFSSLETSSRIITEWHSKVIPRLAAADRTQIGLVFLKPRFCVFVLPFIIPKNDNCGHQKMVTCN
jgi:hypothetical protein